MLVERNLSWLATVVPLLGLSPFLGFYPKPVLDRLQPTVDDLVVHVHQSSDFKGPLPSTSARSEP